MKLDVKRLPGLKDKDHLIIKGIFKDGIVTRVLEVDKSERAENVDYKIYKIAIEMQDSS